MTPEQMAATVQARQVIAASVVALLPLLALLCRWFLKWNHRRHGQ